MKWFGQGYVGDTRVGKLWRRELHTPTLRERFREKFLGQITEPPSVRETAFLWWIEDHLPFVDEHGEPVVRDYEKEEIHEEIQRFVTIFLARGEEEGDGAHCITDGHDRFPHPMDYTVLYRWWPAEDSVYCPNCGTNFPADDLDMNFCYIGKDDERYTEENDGVLCVFCEEVEA